jgi:hypothetical protein
MVKLQLPLNVNILQTEKAILIVWFGYKSLTGYNGLDFQKNIWITVVLFRLSPHIKKESSARFRATSSYSHVIRSRHVTTSCDKKKSAINHKGTP